ncbi:MAG: ABC transporter ATP-binding protein/permease [Bacteriovoracaceae bacterium]|nr:ABC transporter ATP-binding protein/permease [Bacteriovoracaceae bacterium]
MSNLERSGWQTIKSLAKYLWPKDRKELQPFVVFSLLSLVIAKAVNVTVPFLLKASIDSLSGSKIELPFIVLLPASLVISYGAARILASIFGELRDFLFIRVAQNAQRKIALETFSHLHNLSLDFHLSRQTGGISRVIDRGTKGVNFVLTFATFNILPTLIEIILVTGIVYYHFNFTFSLIMFGTIFIYIALTLFVTEWRMKFRKAMNKEETEANSKAIDSLLNYETVKYFSNEQHEKDRYDRSLQRYEQASIQSQFGLSLLNTVQAAVIGLGLMAIMMLTAAGVESHQYTVGDFVLVNTFLIQLYLPLNFLGFVYREIKNSLVDMEKMFELQNVFPSVSDAANAPEMNLLNTEVVFQNVNFSYQPERAILKNVNFKVPSGKTLAIVGPSGSGKSTIARLIFRFYDPQSGIISLGGVSIKDVTQSSLRLKLGMVPQDTVLFNDTIGYNIGYGNPKAGQADIERVAKLAQIHHFIELLPLKYNTQVGERGLKLSGGEKQRVAIARTLLKNPSIFVFDEATSALDSHTEKEIQKSLKEISKNVTTIVIAHRLSTIVDADEIIVLKNGEIVEQGTHHDLILRDQVYAELWSKQKLEQEETGPRHL